MGIMYEREYIFSPETDQLMSPCQICDNNFRPTDGFEVSSFAFR